MNLAALSIKRPVFITAVVVTMLLAGVMSFKKLGVDLFPNITFPVITVYTSYAGAGPKEIETLVSKVLEEQIASTPGLKAVRSFNREGLSIVSAEFTLETDVKYAEQQIRDKVSAARHNLPSDISEPLVRRLDPSEQPVSIISLQAHLSPTELFDLADRIVRPSFEQIPQVALVEIVGGRKREIEVVLDRAKLKQHELSVTVLAQRLKAAGMNIPAGKVTEGAHDSMFRTLGEFSSLDEIGATVVNFMGNEVPIRIRDLGLVKDGMKDEQNRTFYNGTPAVFILVHRQSGANTLEVVKGVMKKLDETKVKLAALPTKPELNLIRDGSKMIKENVDDVQESIILGIILTVVVVFFFLGSARSTLITSLALPNSLLGAFVLMQICGFTINVMTLLALSLAVGLLVDDAIVVRENIFRHIELGEKPIVAALKGTQEVTLAVLATTLAVIAVFGPIAFLQGIIGQFFKEFGLTICFAMLISLFDALTVAPMLSAYFAGAIHVSPKKGIYYYSIGGVLRAFNWVQDRLEDAYVQVLRGVNRVPWLVLLVAIALFAGSLVLAKHVPKTFLPAQDFGEFLVTLDLPPGTSLSAMSDKALEADAIIRSFKEVDHTSLTVGKDGEDDFAEFFVQLVPRKQRDVDTSQFKDKLRLVLRKDFAEAKPIVKDIDLIGGNLRPFMVNVLGQNFEEIEKYSRLLFEKLQANPALKDVDMSYSPGKPEVQITIDPKKAERLGVMVNTIGLELRSQVEGVTPAFYRQNGEEYDVRLRVQDNQRNLADNWAGIFVPNMNFFNVRLSDVASYKKILGPSNINRQNRTRYIQITADLTPGGAGMAQSMQDTSDFMTKDIKLPPDVKFMFVGQAESYAEMIDNMVIALCLAVVFIYLVLCSLYESFVTPFTIMLVLPLAMCGAFAALYITHKSLDLFSMIGCILLLGVAIKNSILLVDYANQKVIEGMPRNEAMILAGRTRLRPILMTTFALIAGMLPIAVGLNEASAQRTSMGIAIIGGLLSSTALTLLVIPAAYAYIDGFRSVSLRIMKRIFSVH
ncbi:MAG: efflux RND transporter permease subunit [Chitinophagaceae bacterium]|nr:efflux RND transporter permease subunit [Oligoflexus sp.]